MVYFYSKIMNLFDIIPGNYFSLFAGKNRAVYLESLLVLYNLLESEESYIKKSDFIKTLKDKAKDIESFTYEDEEFDGEEEEFADEEAELDESDPFYFSEGMHW